MFRVAQVIQSYVMYTLIPQHWALTTCKHRYRNM